VDRIPGHAEDAVILQPKIFRGPEFLVVIPDSANESVYLPQLEAPGMPASPGAELERTSHVADP